MARIYTVALCALLGIAATPAFAALDPVDLKDFIEARFDVKNETPPRMVPWSGDMDDFPAEARDLHLACYAAGYIGSQGAMTVTINSVPVTWGPGVQTENGDGYILLVTGMDGSQTGYGSATQAWAQITGIGSTVYAVGGHALTTAIADNQNTVANANGTNNGYAMAWGGNAFNSRNAGDVYASSYNHGGCLHAFAQGGDAEDGDGGYARAWSHVLTEARGGAATATGNGAGTGSAYAQGGETLSGTGGTATATGDTYAVAYGGNANSAAGSVGGNAIARISSIASGIGCYAQGGVGRIGGNATADCDNVGAGGSGGAAVAVGGNGIHPTGGACTGGDADAISSAAGGTAEAFGGDASTGVGTGGEARAEGPSWITTNTPQAGNPNGGYAFES